MTLCGQTRDAKEGAAHSQQLPVRHQIVHHLFEAGIAAPTEHSKKPLKSVQFCGSCGRFASPYFVLGSIRLSAFSRRYATSALVPLAPRRLATQLAPSPSRSSGATSQLTSQRSRLHALTRRARVASHDAV